MTPWRVGCVSFLNTKPLIAGLEDDPRFNLRFAVPSQLTEMLLAAQVDLALCPVFDFFAHEDALEIVPAGGIASDGETLTVKLFSRVPLAQVCTVAADPDSHTSVNLLRVLLAKKYGRAPAVVALGEPADATLLIGDKVIARAPDSGEFPWTLDLGAAWKEATGLPFVFAVWMKRKGEDLGELPEVLAAQRNLNQPHIQAIADQYAPSLGWPPHAGLARHYLAQILGFEIGPRERQAIALFGQELRHFQLLPHPVKKQRTNIFQCESLAELSRQLSFSPHDHQVQQLLRTERLHDEMLAEPDGAYPLAYLQFRITGLKAMNPASETLFSRAVAHDLREIIDQLSKALKLPIDPADGYVDTQTLALEKKVATRTIARWREAGLRWRWGYLKAGTYFQILFSAAAVRAFESANREKVAYATSFSQLSSEELRRLFTRAQRLAEATGAEPFTVARHIALRTGRATETLRLILLRHDQEEAPENRIFSDYTTPLTPEQKSDIFRAWQVRVRTGELTRRYRRTRATIYRVVLEKRVEQLAAVAKPHHPMPTLAHKDAQAVFLGLPITDFLPPSALLGPADLPEVLRPYFTAGNLPEEKESRLLLRHNYLQYRLHVQLEELRGRTQLVRVVEHAEAAAREARQCRAAIVRLALPVVHSMANRHLGAHQMPGLPPREETLLRLISLSLQVMDDAVDAFNPATAKSGFSHYLGNRLLQRYGQLRAEPASAADRAPLPELTTHLRSRLEGLTQAAVF